MITRGQEDAILLCVGDYLCYTGQDKALQLIINSGKFPARRPSEISTRLNISTLKSFLAQKEELLVGKLSKPVSDDVSTDEDDDDYDDDDVSWNIIVTLIMTVSRNFPEHSEEKFKCLNCIYNLGAYEAFIKAPPKSPIDEFKSDLSLLSTCCGEDVIDGNPFFETIRKETRSYSTLHKKLEKMFKKADIKEMFAKLTAYLDKISGMLKAPMLCAIKNDVMSGNYTPSSNFDLIEETEDKSDEIILDKGLENAKDENDRDDSIGDIDDLDDIFKDNNEEGGLINDIRMGKVPSFTLTELRGLSLSEERWSSIMNLPTKKAVKKPQIESLSGDEEENGKSDDDYVDEVQTIDVNNNGSKSQSIIDIEEPSKSARSEYKRDKKDESISIRSKRVNRLFNDEEVNNLREGVKQYGVGKWSLILKHYKFNDRTSVDLKDKWRNMMIKEKRQKEIEKKAARLQNVKELLKRSESQNDSDPQQRFEGLPLKKQKVDANPNLRANGNLNINDSRVIDVNKPDEKVEDDENEDKSENSDIDHIVDDQPLTDDEYIDFSSGNFAINRSSDVNNDPDGDDDTEDNTDNEEDYDDGGNDYQPLTQQF